MTPDDEVCYCYHVSLRKLLNFAKREQLRHPSQLSECLGAGTGCGWCIPTLCRIARWANTGEEFWHEVTPETYAAERDSYNREKKPRHRFDPHTTGDGPPDNGPAAIAALRFALLEHATQDGVHWDLLLELPGQERLATWRLGENPLLAADEIAAERLPDHRRVYLDYEGPLSGDRGSVRRLDRGPVEIHESGPDAVIVSMAGAGLCDSFALRRVGDSWLLERRPG